MSCEQMSAEVFVEYWSGELETVAGEALEEHLFACEDCAQRAEKLAMTANLVRQATLVGGIAPLSLTRSALERLGQDGVPIRHYSIKRGETVACQATPDHFSVVHLQIDAPMSETRIDLEVETSLGERIESEAVSINRLDGEVTLAWPGEMVRAQPTGVLVLTLSEVDAGERRLLGEYRLAHSAS